MPKYEDYDELTTLSDDDLLLAVDDAGGTKKVKASTVATYTGGGGGGGGGLDHVVDDTTPQLGGQLDVNGEAIGDGTRELITFVEDASAVNHVEIENEATGSGPTIRAAGDDTNIDLNLEGKGTGVVKVDGASLASTYLAKSALPVTFTVAASDESTAIDATGTKLTFRMPYAMTVSEVRASLNSACSTGTFTVDINEGGSTILSTKLTIDATEKTSTTAAAAAVISDSALADDAEITIDVDDDGDSTGAGLKVTFIGTRDVS